MLGIIGGTGPEGRGLGLRYALAGEDIFIGSRSTVRAEQIASRISSYDIKGRVKGGSNEEAAQESDILIISVPYSGHFETLTALQKSLAEKIVIDVVVPLSIDQGRALSIPVEQGSVAKQAEGILLNSNVVAAFQTISARDLLIPDKIIDSDVVVCSNDTDAKLVVMSLVEKIADLRAVDGGDLENAGYLENFTALLLNINKIYKAHSSLRITGI